jgi:hypothetical protein
MLSSYQKVKEDPEKYKEYLEKKRACYRAKKSANLEVDLALSNLEKIELKEKLFSYNTLRTPRP